MVGRVDLLHRKRRERGRFGSYRFLKRGTPPNKIRVPKSKLITLNFCDATNDSNYCKNGDHTTTLVDAVLIQRSRNEINIVNTEYLRDLFVAIPKHDQETFESNVYMLGNNLVG